MPEVQHPANRLVHRLDSSDAPSKAPASENTGAEERLYTHLIAVLSVSSGMVGVCLTAIGLIGIMKRLNRVETLVDELLAIGAVLFMIAAILSFLAMRTRLGKTWRGCVRTLDLLFCLGLVLVVVATLLLTWMVV